MCASVSALTAESLTYGHNKYVCVCQSIMAKGLYMRGTQEVHERSGICMVWWDYQKQLWYTTVCPVQVSGQLMEDYSFDMFDTEHFSKMPSLHCCDT